MMTAIEQASPSSIYKAAALLAAGELVAFPTETVYGLGADATNERAVARIYEAKGRPQFNPLIIHAASVAELEAIVVMSELAYELAAAFWPGPLTLVLPRAKNCTVSLLAGAGLDTLAVRLPAQKTALALLTAFGRPVAAPSANPSGGVSPTTPLHVKAGLDGKLPLILADGKCAVGVESTILDLTDAAPRLLRPGGVTLEDIEARLGTRLDRSDAGATPRHPAAPGMLASHYAPSLPVRLNAATPMPGEGWLSFGPVLPQLARAATQHLSLSDTGDLTEAAANLFAYLRALDQPEITAISVAPIPETGLGLAINDRLRRAAAPRG